MRETESIAKFHRHGSPRGLPHGPILVVLADDHEVMRRNLKALLDGEHDIRVVAEAGDLVAAADQVREHAPQVLVLDLRLPDGSTTDRLSGSGLELTALVRTQMPSTQVVVITMQENEAFVGKTVDSGAVGFVRKDMAETELVDAVRAAARGERYTSSRVTRH
ncbi:MAG: response regulator transcription factor [Solirubrobacteraceae bacterium]